MTGADDCSCKTCVSACKHKPGWFKPGQVELVAQHLGISVEELFKTKLGVDYWAGEDESFVIAPAVTEMEPGKEYPFKPTGRCVFLTEDERCAIHPVKPYECRSMIHGQGKAKTEKIKARARDAWKIEEGQAQITTLLGRQPKVPGVSIFDALDFMIDELETFEKRSGVE